MSEIDQSIVSHRGRTVRSVIRHRTMSHEREISEHHDTEIAQHEECNTNSHPLHSDQHLVLFESVCVCCVGVSWSE